MGPKKTKFYTKIRFFLVPSNDVVSFIIFLCGFSKCPTKSTRVKTFAFYIARRVCVCVGEKQQPKEWDICIDSPTFHGVQNMKLLHKCSRLCFFPCFFFLFFFLVCLRRIITIIWDIPMAGSYIKVAMSKRFSCNKAALFFLSLHVFPFSPLFAVVHTNFFWLSSRLIFSALSSFFLSLPYLFGAISVCWIIHFIFLWHGSSSRSRKKSMCNIRRFVRRKTSLTLCTRVRWTHPVYFCAA